MKNIISPRTVRYINRSYKKDLEYYNNLLNRKNFESNLLKDDIAKWKISYDIIKTLYSELYNSHSVISETVVNLRENNENLRENNEKLENEIKKLKDENEKLENENLLKELINHNL
jgi:predicted nuclease with TOPRIM domain